MFWLPLVCTATLYKSRFWLQNIEIETKRNVIDARRAKLRLGGRPVREFESFDIYINNKRPFKYEIVKDDIKLGNQTTHLLDKFQLNLRGASLGDDGTIDVYVNKKYLEFLPDIVLKFEKV
tara:strand:- start:3060 stop:3422 length:363 start_codon:yes stop_codon:yes gene_type:complete